MRLIPQTSRRTWLLIEFAAAEIGAVWCLYKGDFLIFLVISTLVAVLAATVLKIDYLIRHDVTNFGVCITIGIAAGAAGLWFAGYRAFAIASGVAAVLFTGNIIRKLLRPLDLEQQEANAIAYRARAESEREKIGPIEKDLLSLACFVVFAAVIWWFNDFAFTQYLDIILYFALLDVCSLIYHIITRKKSVIAAPDSSEITANRGDLP
jgi:hypothetical protein